MLLISLINFGLLADENEDYKKGGELFKQGKFEEALKLVDDAIKKYGETPRWLAGKFYILLSMKKFDQALELAIDLDDKANQKSPYNAIEIATLYLKHKKNESEAIKWLSIAVDRDFLEYTYLEEQETFQSLRENPKFNALIKKMKDTIGINKPPKDFTLTLLSGESFTLSKQKGKVVLVDFWASWCGPCVKEMPSLKKTYDQYRSKGFEIIGISLDKTKDKLTHFIKENALKWPISFSGDYWKDKTVALYGVRSIPSTWLVDKKGILRHTNLRGEELEHAVAELLEE